MWAEALFFYPIIFPGLKAGAIETLKAGAMETLKAGAMERNSKVWLYNYRQKTESTEKTRIRRFGSDYQSIQ